MLVREVIIKEITTITFNITIPDTNSRGRGVIIYLTELETPIIWYHLLVLPKPTAVSRIYRHSSSRGINHHSGKIMQSTNN